MTHDLSLFTRIITSSDDEVVQHRKATVTFRLKLTLIDSSVLYIRENVVRDTLWIDYAYHWQTSDHTFIHRWDNAHPVGLPTSSHHQHIGSEENIQPADAMTLEKVLAYIAIALLRQ